MTYSEQLEIIKKEFGESCVQDIYNITNGILEEDLIIIILYEIFLYKKNHSYFSYKNYIHDLKKTTMLSVKISKCFNSFNWSKSSQKYMNVPWGELWQRYHNLSKVWKNPPIISQNYPIH